MSARLYLLQTLACILFVISFARLLFVSLLGVGALAGTIARILITLATTDQLECNPSYQAQQNPKSVFAHLFPKLRD
jgi:hypothetical protein